MSRSEERRRILDLLALGSITVEQAADLLKALGPTQAETLPLPPVRPTPAMPPQAPQPPHVPQMSSAPTKRRFVRIEIDSVKGDGRKDAKVRVNVPIALAKFALRFVPADAKAEMSAQGIDIAQLLEGFDYDVTDGKLLDLHTDRGDGDGSAHITIEVV